MSEPTTDDTPKPKAPPRVCRTCSYWVQDEHPGTPDAWKVWGYCTIGLPAGTTLTGRQTTDLLCCTGHVYREVKA